MQKQENPTYLKAITIRDISDVHSIKEDIKKDMILILRVTPLAQKDVEQLRKVVEELYSIAKTAGAGHCKVGRRENHSGPIQHKDLETRIRSKIILLLLGLEDNELLLCTYV